MNTPGTVLWINLCLFSCFKWDFHENSPVFRSVASKGRLLAMQACCQSQDDALKVKTSKRLPCLSYRLQYMQCKKIPKQIIVYSKEHCVNVIGICRNYNLANCSIFLWAVLCCVHASGKICLFMFGLCRIYYIRLSSHCQRWPMYERCGGLGYRERASETTQSGMISRLVKTAPSARIRRSFRSTYRSSV